MDDYDFELDEKETAPPKPYTPERTAYWAELMNDISDLVKELM